MRTQHEYYDVMEELIQIFGNKTFITFAELGRAEGCDPRTAAKRYGAPPGAKGIDRAILARRKCDMAKDPGK